MSEVKMTAEDARSAVKNISAQVEALENIISDVSSAHNKLLLDDVFSLESYSLMLLPNIASANSKIKKAKKKCESLGSLAGSAITGLMEADANSAGNQTGASEKISGGNNWLKWMVAAATPGGLITYSVISIIGNLFNGSSDSSSTEIVSITPWKGKEIVDQKSEEVHSYYEEIMADHEEWEKAQKIYNYNGTDYETVSGFQDGIMKQSTNYNCTSTAWCYGDHLLTGRNYTASDTLTWPQWGAEGAQFPGQGENAWYNGNYTSMLKLAYSELSDGKPCVFYGQRSSQPHAVTIVGMVSGADGNNLKLSDFLVVDPADGVIKRLDEVGYKYGIRTISYK